MRHVPTILFSLYTLTGIAFVVWTLLGRGAAADGCTQLAPLEVVVAMLASPTGAAQVALPIPALPSLLGVELSFQGAHPSPATPLGLELSRGLRVRIGD